MICFLNKVVERENDLKKTSVLNHSFLSIVVSYRIPKNLTIDF